MSYGEFYGPHTVAGHGPYGSGGHAYGVYNPGYGGHSYGHYNPGYGGHGSPYAGGYSGHVGLPGLGHGDALVSGYKYNGHPYGASKPGSFGYHTGVPIAHNEYGSGLSIYETRRENAPHDGTFHGFEGHTYGFY